METLVGQYADWKAPAEEGRFLIWPEPGLLLRQTRQNHRRLSTADEVRIQGVPLPKVRQTLRQWIGHADSDQLLIGTGHQTELYHPGVWAKDVLIDAVASACDGAAYHFAVDTDSPKHLTIQWPGANWPLTDDSRLTTAAWSGLLTTPTPLHLRHIHQAVDQVSWKEPPMLGPFLDSIRRLILETDNLSSALTNAQHQLDWSLGLRHHALLCSPMWHNAGYLLLAHHILARAKRFASHYNEALREYRGSHGIEGVTRPMPDLDVSGEHCEAPFWLDDLVGGQRRRAMVSGTAGQWRLTLDNGDAFAFSESAEGWSSAEKLGQWLTRHQVRLAPRALTLTLLLRLLVTDQFVHGIGGGRYDQVLDRLIMRHFQFEPPCFSVTTATLFHPDAAGEQRACVPCVIQEGHHLRHSLLGDEKWTFLRKIEALPRRSLARQSEFQAMHDRLDAAGVDHPAMQNWHDSLQAARQQAQRDEILFSRELFYAIQPQSRLADLRDQFRQRMKQV